MGAELDKLMKQYGVGTASIPAYTGTAQPTAPTDTKSKTYAADKAKYDTDLASYNADQTKYNQFVQDYKNRIANTPMYAQPQFQVGQPAPANVSSIFNAAPTAQMGYNPASLSATIPDAAKSAVQTAVATPNVTQQTITDLANKYNLSNSDIYNLTGSFYGATLQNPFVKTAAKGGYIKNYSTGGPEDRGLSKLAAGYDVPDITEDANPANLPIVYAQAASPTVSDTGPNPPAAPVAQPPAPSTAAPSTPAATVLPSADAIKELFEKYNTGKDYTSEIRAATEKSKSETEAFRNMLANAMKGNEQNMPSKAEMYFRLAAALGAPTKTKQGFVESLSGAAKEMADYQKSVTEAKRANTAQNLQLALKGQEIGMQTAKEELNTLRGLQGEENKDRRTLATEMLKEYIRSGEPQSAAGKQAKDEGLRPGTPEYQKRVEEITRTGVEAKTAEIAAKLTKMENDNIRTELAKRKQEETEKSLTPQELKLKTETEDNLAQSTQAMQDLKKAYALNPNTFDTSLTDIAQRKVLENTQSDHPKVVATREMENLLAKGAVNKLRAAFGGNPTEGEREILLKLEGIGAKSKEERKQIMLDAFQALQTSTERHQKRLKDIESGKYREKKSGEGAE